MTKQLFRPDLLPRKCDVVRHVQHLRDRDHLDKQQAYRKTAKDIYDIWSKADCPPISEKHIIQRIQVLIEKEYRKPKELGVSRRGKHKRSKSAPSPRPTRRSSRINPNEIPNSSDQPIIDESPSDDAASPLVKKKSNVRTRAQLEENPGEFPETARRNWMDLEGQELFDVLSTQKLNETKQDSGDNVMKSKQLTFDKEFYEDQKHSRKRKLEGKVNDKFLEEEKKKAECFERKQKRIESAYGFVRDESSNHCAMEDFPIDNDDPDFNIMSVNQSVVSNKEVLYHCSTRNHPKNDDESKISRGCQTTPVEFHQIRTRDGKRINPIILETAVECESVARCSMDTTIKVIQIVANRIFGQTWVLPLSMNEKYLKDVKTLRRLKNSLSSKGQDDEQKDEESDDDGEIEYEISCLSDESAPTEVQEKKERICELKRKIEEHKKGKEFRLPSPKSIRNTRQLIAYEAERLISLEMISKQSALIPDGTGRKVVGKVGGVVIQSDSKLRTLPFQKMGNETRDNWSDLVEYLLKRMSVLSGRDKLDFWKSIVLFISDQCKVNKGLAEEVATKLGAIHKPGQVFCNIHPILMFDEKVKKKWCELEKKIGAEKLFPSLSYANLDQENFMVSVQCLDAMMSLISPGKSHKAWSRYFDFNRYISPNVNHAYCLKDRRFGQLPALCLVALHHFDDLINYLDSVPSCRNQLACLCRGMVDIDEYLKFIWAGVGILGIHLYEPYLNIIIDLCTPQSKLLQIFPQLYSEMLDSPAVFCDIQVPALKSLTAGWRSPTSVDSPYKIDVVNSLQKFLDRTDRAFMESHVRSLLKIIASGFADQKGRTKCQGIRVYSK